MRRRLLRSTDSSATWLLFHLVPPLLLPFVSVLSVP